MSETEQTPDQEQNTGDLAPDFGAPKVTPNGAEAPAPQEPPKRRRKPASAAEPPARRRAPRQPPLKQQIQDFFGMVSVAIGATGDFYCANVVATQAEPMAEAWADLARKDERVRAIIERLMEGSAWGGVIFATMVTVIPIAAHHGLYPKGMPMPFDFGFGPPPPPSDEVADEHRRTGHPGTEPPPVP